MAPKFYSQRGSVYGIFNIRYVYLLLSLASLFFFVRIATYQFNSHDANDKNGLLIGCLFFIILFLAFSFEIVEINCDKKIIISKRIFTIWKKSISFENDDIQYLIVRHSTNGVFSGIDVVAAVKYKQIVLKRLFSTKKIDLLIEETKSIVAESKV